MAIHVGDSALGFAAEYDEQNVLLIADAAFALGDTVMCTMNATGDYTGCTAPTAQGMGVPAGGVCFDGVFGVVLKPVASGGVAEVRLRGLVLATALSTSDANYTMDGAFIPTTGKRLEFDQANPADVNKKLVALSTIILTGGGTVTSTPALRTVAFDGVNGFGRHGGTIS